MEGHKPFENFEEFVSEEVDTDWFKDMEMKMRGIQNKIERLKEFSGHVEQEVEAKYGKNRVKFEGAIYRGNPAGRIGITSDDFDVANNIKGIRKIVEESAKVTGTSVEILEEKQQGSATVDFIMKLPKNLGPIVQAVR